MKKTILSLATILFFGIYALFSKFGTTSSVQIYKPKPVSVELGKVNNTPNTPTKIPAPVVNTPPPIIKPKVIGMYKDGTFIGDSIDAFYGNVQVFATITDGRLSDIAFLDYPQDRRTSLQKSNYAMPILKREAISAQKANVNTVSGVTYTSEAFIQSLTGALNQAKNA